MARKKRWLLSALVGVVLALVTVLGTSTTAYAVEVGESFTTNQGGKAYTGTHFTISGTSGDGDGLGVGMLEGKSGQTVTVSSRNGEIITRIEAHVGYMENNGSLSVNPGTLSGFAYQFRGQCDISVTNISATSVTFAQPSTEWGALVQLKTWTIYYEGVDVSGVTLEPSTAQTIDVGESVRMEATVLPNDAEYKTVMWSVDSDPAGAVVLYSDSSCETPVELGVATDVLTVYAKGESGGSATVAVTATNGTDGTDDDKSASCAITVNKLEQTIDAQGVTATYGDTGKGVGASVTDPEQGGGELSYAVKDGGDVIDVDAKSGALTIKKAGTATVTVTAAETDGYAQTTKDVAVTVNKAANPAAVSGDAAVKRGGNTVDLKGNVKLNGATGDVTYAFDGDSNGCTLSGSVLTSGSNSGAVTVKVTVAEDGNYEALEAKTITVTVTDKDTQTITAEDVTATVGDTGKKVSAKTGGDGKLGYAVKDGSDVVDVDATTGALTIKKAGKATVTVTASETAAYAKATKDVTVTVTEKPEPKTATLTFDLAGGALDGKTGKVTMEATVGETVKLPGAPTRDGYTFKCWRGSEYAAGADYKVEGDHEFTAEWTKNGEPSPEPTPTEKATLTFDANGGTGSMDKVTAEKGTKLTLPANQFKRDGYTFAGWNTAKDGKGTSFTDKGTVTLNGDATLYAQWTKNSSPKNGSTTPSKSDSTSKKNSLPSTGDPTSLMAIAAIAAAGAGAILAGRRRRG